jgi:hypothetical protein
LPYKDREKQRKYAREFFKKYYQKHREELLWKTKERYQKDRKKIIAQTILARQKRIHIRRIRVLQELGGKCSSILAVSLFH